jgi:uncharacterized protein
MGMGTVSFLRQQGAGVCGFRSSCRASEYRRHGINVARFTGTVKTIRLIAFILIILGAINLGLVGLLQIDGLAALMDGPSSTISRIVYSLIGLAGLIAAVIIFASDRDSSRPNILGRMGRSSGADRGPDPGDGAVIHHASGEADFGLPGNALPPAQRTTGDQPYPPDKSAD